MKIVFTNTAKESVPDIQTGAEKIFLKLFKLFKNKVYSYSLHITHSEIVAEDITQEVFMKLWLHRQSLAEIDNIEAWIITIARNLCFNQLKKKALEQKLSTMAIVNHVQENVDDYILYKDRLNEVTQIVNRLPKQQRIIFNLNRNDGLKNDEIARQLNISANTVKSHFTKALQTIRQTLQTHSSTLIVSILLCKYFF